MRVEKKITERENQWIESFIFIFFCSIPACRAFLSALWNLKSIALELELKQHLFYWRCTLFNNTFPAIQCSWIKTLLSARYSMMMIMTFEFIDNFLFSASSVFFKSCRCGKYHFLYLYEKNKVFLNFGLFWLQIRAVSSKIIENIIFCSLSSCRFCCSVKIPIKHSRILAKRSVIEQKFH